MGSGVAGFVMSLIGLFLFPPLLLLSFLFSLIGLGNKDERAYAVAGIIISLLALGGWVLLFILVLSPLLFLSSPVMLASGVEAVSPAGLTFTTLHLFYVGVLWSVACAGGVMALLKVK